MAKEGDWVTEPIESPEHPGEPILFTYRTDLEEFRSNPRFRYRITVVWQYASIGMPTDEQAELMEQATERLQEAFLKDPVAVLTEIATGNGQRQWVFYTLSLHIFQRKFNEALASLPPIPLEFEATEEPIDNA